MGTLSGGFCGCMGGGFCGCKGGVFCGCVMMGGGYYCVGGGLSSLPCFLGFFDASILKKFKK